MKWINVEDRLPPIGLEVLCYRPDTGDDLWAKPLKLYARAANGRFPGLYHVTHWLEMDLPPGWTDDNARRQHA